LDVADDRASSCSFGDCVPYETLDQIHGQPEILKSLYGAAARDAIQQNSETVLDLWAFERNTHRTLRDNAV